MASATHIRHSKIGGADLCDGCCLALFDDSEEDFYEGKMSKDNDQPTLRHKETDGNQNEDDDNDDEDDGDDDEPEAENNEEQDKNNSEPTHTHMTKREREREHLVLPGSPRVWKDELPGLPKMAETADAGCRLCQFLREALLRRQVSFQGPIKVRAQYLWGFDRDYFAFRDDGLVAWRCEVVEAGDSRGFLGALNFNIETDNVEIKDWLRMDQKRRPEPLDPCNVERMRDQIHSCKSQCNHIEDNSHFLPTRLIDVGVEGGDDPRLVIAKDLQKNGEDHGIKYATLSYCWGSKEDAAQQVKTTASNISQHLQSIPFGDMSPVVKDTITVCRALSIRHVWIDALCILQDDSIDWDEQSQMMGEVFYCSSLTICPSSSKSCLEGFLKPRPQGLDIEFQSSLRKDIRGTYTLFDSLDSLPGLFGPGDPHTMLCKEVDIDKSSWAERGWTFQERVLSVRTLFFGASMCHFHCEGKNGREISENDYETASYGGHCRHWHFFNRLNSKGLTPKVRDDLTKVMRSQEQWTVTWGTASRKWTFREEILAGISGLAKEYAAMTDDDYLAGLWKSNLHRDLTWKIIDPKPGDLEKTVEEIRGQSPYVAPSWSWASQQEAFEESMTTTYSKDEDERSEDGEPVPDRDVLDTINENETEETRFKGWAKSISLPCHIKHELKLEGSQMDLWGKNPYGRLNGAFITVSGKVVPFPSDVAMEPRSETELHPRPSGYFLNNHGTCYLDWSSRTSTIQQPGEMQLLLVSSCCAATSSGEC